MKLYVALLASTLASLAASQILTVATPPTGPPGPAGSPPASTATPGGTPALPPAPPSKGKSCYIGDTYCGSVLMDSQGYTVQDLANAISASRPAGSPGQQTPSPEDSVYLCQATPGTSPPGGLGPGCAAVGSTIAYLCACSGANGTSSSGSGSGSGAGTQPGAQAAQGKCQNNPPWRIAYCPCEFV